MISVIIELPFLNSIPPIAGSSANAKGAECHAEVSEDSCPALLGFGSRRSSVDSWNAFRASESERSEKFEERLRGSFPATFVAEDGRRVRTFDSSIVKALRRRVPPLVGGGSSAISITCHVVVDVWRCLAWCKDVGRIVDGGGILLTKSQILLLSATAMCLSLSSSKNLRLMGSTRKIQLETSATVIRHIL
jgi:hypothetical protein